MTPTERKRVAETTNGDTSKNSFVSKYAHWVALAITIVGFIVTFSVSWAGNQKDIIQLQSDVAVLQATDKTRSDLELRVGNLDSEVEKIWAAIYKLQSLSTDGLVRFAEIQKDLTAIRESILAVGMDTIEVRKALTEMQTTLYSMRDSYLQGTNR